MLAYSEELLFFSLSQSFSFYTIFIYDYFSVIMFIVSMLFVFGQGWGESTPTHGHNHEVNVQFTLKPLLTRLLFVPN